MVIKDAMARIWIQTRHRYMSHNNIFSIYTLNKMMLIIYFYFSFIRVDLMDLKLSLYLSPLPIMKNSYTTFMISLEKLAIRG